MVHLHKKIKKGRPYYYLREMKRVRGKPTVVEQIYLGSPETMVHRFREIEAGRRPQKLKAQEFGALFLAHQVEQVLDTIGIIDQVVPRSPRESGPTVGEYFFYAWANRLIEPKSKNALADWYGKTAIQEMRPFQSGDLSAQRFWAKWDRVDEEAIEKIGEALFARIWKLQGAAPECLLFDTTNYYTYMASQTPSELCERGHSKDGKHHLRQVGLALLVERQTHLPLFYRAYEGNRHDAKLFHRVIDEMFGVMCRFNETKQRLTVVFDKGMNSEDNIAFIDDHTRIHFVTTYSPYFVESLATTDLRKFSPLALASAGESEETDQLRAWRTRQEFWGQDRTVVVTYNPRTYRKKCYTFEQKLEKIRRELLLFRRNYRENRPQWRDPVAILDRYHRACEQLHIGSQYYQLDFGDRRRAPELSFRKDHQQVAKSEALFGKNVILTDNHDWTTEEIVRTSLDRHVVETQFRETKSPDNIRVQPLRHWTDSKIRCHLLTCVMALVALNLIEQRTRAQGVVDDSGNLMSGRRVLEAMQNLHSVVLWYPGKRKAERMMETPTKTQAKTLEAFGWEISPGGVLQEVSA